MKSWCKYFGCVSNISRIFQRHQPGPGQGLYRYLYIYIDLGPGKGQTAVRKNVQLNACIHQNVYFEEVQM